MITFFQIMSLYFFNLRSPLHVRWVRCEYESLVDPTLVITYRSSMLSFSFRWTKRNLSGPVLSVARMRSMRVFILMDISVSSLSKFTFIMIYRIWSVCWRYGFLRICTLVFLLFQAHARQLFTQTLHKIIFQKLLWKYEETRHANKPTRSEISYTNLTFFMRSC